MFKNYLKTAYRHLVRQPGYTALNVIGLTIGITSSLIIVLYLVNELSYDTHHENADNIISILLHFVMFFSMIDGAFLSYMTENTTDQRCPFCHKLPR